MLHLPTQMEVGNYANLMYHWRDWKHLQGLNLSIFMEVSYPSANMPLWENEMLTPLSLKKREILR